MTTSVRQPDAHYRWIRDKRPQGHKLDGDLTRSIAKLGSLFLSDVTLSPELDDATAIHIAMSAASISVSKVSLAITVEHPYPSIRTIRTPAARDIKWQ